MLDKMLTEVFSDSWLNMFLNELLDEDRKTDLSIHDHQCLFIPYVGNEYRNAKTKILFIGRETNGCGEIYCSNCGKELDSKKDKDFSGTYRCPNCHRKVLDRLSDVVDNKDNPQLLQLLTNCTIDLMDKRITPKIRKSNELHKLRYQFTIGFGESFKAVAWSNVFKVSQLGAPPKSKMRLFLAKNEINTLRQEIQLLGPDVIVFNLSSTPWYPKGNFYDRYINNTFDCNVKCVETPFNMVHRLYGITDKAIVIRTPHPSRGKWPNWRNELPALIDYLKDELNKKTKKRC